MLLVMPYAAGAETSVSACAAPAHLEDGVAKIIDADTFETKSRRIIRLSGLQAPKRPIVRNGREEASLAQRGKKTLAKLILGKPVVLVPDNNKTDRYGRTIAQVFMRSTTAGEFVWIQAEMIKRGLARAYPNTTEAFCLTELLKLEKDARKNQAGLWKEPFFQVSKAEDLKQLNRSIGRLQLVEGRVEGVSVRRTRSYINFSKNWNSDFTVTVNRNVHKKFTQSGVNLEDLAGKRIRVRGWLDRRNGPTISARHVAQIEILDD